MTSAEEIRNCAASDQGATGGRVAAIKLTQMHKGRPAWLRYGQRNLRTHLMGSRGRLDSVEIHYSQDRPPKRDLRIWDIFDIAASREARDGASRSLAATWGDLNIRCATERADVEYGSGRAAKGLKLAHIELSSENRRSEAGRFSPASACKEQPCPLKIAG
jgi:hypothetical protein